MISTQTLLQRIESELATTNYPSQPEGLYEPIEYVLEEGGKRLRPTLLLLTYSLYCDDIDRAMPAAIGLETYHNHTLLHDDLMDHADMRRGRPTVHRKWNENTAVLSGDTMLIMAFRHIMACRCERQQDILQLFARTAQEICEGQQYDVNFETRNDVSLSEYIEMIRLKTAVFLGCATQMGALIANADHADCEALYAFAQNIGLAFQIQDDYLDVYGDPAVFGKKIGGDILCGKKTFLLINAFNRADNATRQRLLALIEDHEMDATKKIKDVTDIYNELDIPAITLDAISHFYDEANDVLKRAKSSIEFFTPLVDYTSSLLGRKN